jgi:S-adenosylmethionine hydrolase
MKRATLLTDFGTQDGYVAAMKGVITAIAPSSLIDDASHDIPPGDILAAAFALRRYWRLYPPGTVHVVVIDPGVGTDRSAIALAADGRFFVGPDNGVFTFIPAHQAVQLAVPAESAHTFHGRDVFAPAAGKLLRGDALEQLGAQAVACISLDIPQPHGNAGEVLMVDRFGNLITNFTGGGDVEIEGREVKLRRTYGDVAEGELLALINSDGLLEIAVRNGSAAETLNVSRGARVTLRL